MKVIRILLLIIVTTFSTTSFGQVPGYEGKLWSAGYDVLFFPALGRPTYQGNGNILNQDDASFGMNIRHRVFVDRTLSTQIILGGSLHYLRTAYDFSQWTLTPSGFVVDEGFNRMSTIGVGAHIKLFHANARGTIAPVGRYSMLEVVYLMSDVRRKDESNKDFSSSDLALTYTWGDQVVYFDFLVLNIGIQFGVVPSVIPYLASDKPETHEEGAKDRLARNMFMNVNFGIAVLF